MLYVFPIPPVCAKCPANPILYFITLTTFIEEYKLNQSHGRAHVMWGPVTMAWHIPRLWMATNISNKQLQTVNKGWSSSLVQNVTQCFSAGPCEHGKEPSGSIKGKFID